MKRLAIAVGTILTAAAATASAQVYYRSYTYDPYYAPAVSGTECWNPRARQFEELRPNEFQDDLDRSRCRVIGSRIYEMRTYDSRGREECWNPRAGHYELVRPWERQDDLDYSRCRIVRHDRYAYR